MPASKRQLEDNIIAGEIGALLLAQLSAQPQLTAPQPGCGGSQHLRFRHLPLRRTGRYRAFDDVCFMSYLALQVSRSYI